MVTTADCPTCGAGISDRMTRCSYCGSTLYYSRKPGTDNIARVGNKVMVVRHEPVHLPTWSTQEGGQEYHGKGGTFTTPSVGVGYVICPTEDEVEEWNNRRRRHDAEMARPYKIRLGLFIIICAIAYMLLWVVTLP